MKEIYTKTKRGGVLIYGMIVIGLVSVIFAGLIQYVVSSARLSFFTVRSERSLHVAEAGVYFYRWYLAHNIQGKTATQVQQFWANNPLGVDDNGDGDCDDVDTADGDGNGKESYIVAYTDGVEIMGTYEVCVTPPSIYSTSVIVKVKGVVRDVERTIQARLRQPSWSERAILADSDMRLSADTEIFGTMHSNGGFRFDGITHNIISSSRETYTDPDSGSVRPGVWRDGGESIGCDDVPTAAEQDRFKAGKQCPNEAIDFDDATADFNVIRSTAQTTGTYYPDTGERGYYVELGLSYDPSLMRITEVDQYNTETFERTVMGDVIAEVVMPSEGVLYFEDNVWVKGEVPSGYKLTLVAHSPLAGMKPHIILGDDDVLFEDYTTNTILALAAKGNVHIMRYIKGDRSSSSSETLRIDAALLAQSGNVGWTVPDGTSGGDWWDNTIDAVTIYGAIISKQRFGFGYTSGAGFQNRDIIFNNDLLISPPPLFPTEGSYEIDLWDEVRD